MQQYFLSHELFMEDATLVHFLPSVYATVFPQVTNFSESFLADTTLVWLLPIVYVTVFPQVASMSE